MDIDPIIIGILICVGFMGVVITIISVILKARRLRRQQEEQMMEEPFEPQ